MIDSTTDTRAASRTVGMRDWVSAFEPVLVTAFAGLFLFLIDVGCPFRFFFGISCPGCGMTRAWLAFFTGDVARAFALRHVPETRKLGNNDRCAPLHRRYCALDAANGLGGGTFRTFLGREARSHRSSDQRTHMLGVVELRRITSHLSTSGAR